MKQSCAIQAPLRMIYEAVLRAMLNPALVIQELCFILYIPFPTKHVLSSQEVVLEFLHVLC